MKVPEPVIMAMVVVRIVTTALIMMIVMKGVGIVIAMKKMITPMMEGFLGSPNIAVASVASCGAHPVLRPGLGGTIYTSLPC